MPLLWRVFVINAVLFTAAAVALVVTPATVSAELQPREALVLALGVLTVLIADFLLVRQSMIPLERLAGLMRRVDLLSPGSRIPATGGGAEIDQLGSTFNEMLDRIERERRDSARRAVETEEQVRRRIALELHDEVGQLLTGVVLGLDRLAHEIPAEHRDRVIRLQDIVRDGAEQVRGIARGLRPPSLEELGLRSALIGLITITGDVAGIAVFPQIQTNLPALPPDVELAVFRIAQESLTNVVRHASATRVDVAVTAGAGWLQLTVRDDGRGFEPDADALGYGIPGMRERALIVGGDLEVRSAGGSGTSIRLSVPTGAQAA